MNTVTISYVNSCMKNCLLSFVIFVGGLAILNLAQCPFRIDPGLAKATNVSYEHNPNIGADD